MSASTVQVLVDVFKFSRERSEEAIAAIKDPTDVQEAYNWLLDNGEPDQGGPVIPTQTCPHLLRHSLLLASGVVYGSSCSADSCESMENWLCLECGKLCCSRYALGHMKHHYKETKAAGVVNHLEAESHGHCLALSTSDLSVWCYECDKYVKHASLEPVLLEMANLKFGERNTAQQSSVNRTGICFDKTMDKHKPTAAPGTVRALESPGRTAAMLHRLSESALLSQCVSVPCVPASTDELLGVHDSDYLKELMATAASGSVGEEARADFEARAAERVNGGEEDEEAVELHCEPEADVYITEHSFNAASASTGAVLQLVKAVCSAPEREASTDRASTEVPEGEIANGFALCRPPGHHAHRAHAAGFCLLNNVAVAAEYALHAFGGTSGERIERVLVLDLDVHHGDGIQDIFYADERVLYISVHRHEHAPGIVYSV
jgi:acetoin utilization deacetylase AcuC-like enzyme